MQPRYVFFAFSSIRATLVENPSSPTTQAPQVSAPLSTATKCIIFNKIREKVLGPSTL
jgi:hypothetical protein